MDPTDDRYEKAAHLASPKPYRKDADADLESRYFAWLEEKEAELFEAYMDREEEANDGPDGQ